MRKLLMIDDNEEILVVFEEIFSVEYEVYTAKDGEEGLKKYLEVKPDLILLDIVMPVLDGYGVLDVIRNTHGDKKTKILMVTSTIKDSREGKKAISLGADDFLTKPFHGRELIKCIEKLLEI